MTFTVEHQHVVVVGGGRSGLSAAALLASRGANVTLSDSASTLDGADRLRDLGVQVELGPHRPELLAAADLIVLSPGVPPTQPAVAAARRAGVPVMGEIELASRWINGRIVAITGTKGKSTTTTLTARMLQAAGMPAVAGGNLGMALSGQVAESRADTVHVVEVSSFQLETTETFHPWVAVLVNLSADHLDRHASFDEYAAAKARIFANQRPEDWAIVNADDAASVALAAGTRARRFDFALDAPIADGIAIDGQHIVRRDAGVSTRLMPLSAVHLPGRHLLADVLAATAAACVVGAPAAAIERAVEEFRGLEHALEQAGEVGGVRFINDSKATNIASARRALESFERGIVAIMGGRYKGGDFADLGDIAAARVDAIVTIGEASDRIAAALGQTVPVHHAASMREAVQRAFTLARPGGVVLLAPACSSFDMFTDYAARGRAFKDEVRALAREGRGME